MILPRRRRDENAHASQPGWSRLWRLTAMPRSEFSATYGVLIRHTLETVGSDHPRAGMGLGNALEQALLGRRGQLLPPGADPEERARLSELMSFLLSALVCLDYCDNRTPAGEQRIRGVAPRAMKLARLLGGRNVAWVVSEPQVLGALDDLLGPSPEVAAGRSHPCSVTASRVPDEPAGPVKDKPAEAVSAGERFLRWLREALASGALPYNVARAPVHVVAQGRVALICPAVFEAYERAAGIEAKRARNQFTRKRWHLIKRNGQNLYAGDLNGTRVHALLLKDARKLWPDPPAASHLFRLTSEPGTEQDR